MTSASRPSTLSFPQAAAITVAVGVLLGGTAVAMFWGLLGIVLSARSPRDGRGWIAWLAGGIVLGSAVLSGLFRSEVLAFVVAPDALPSASAPGGSPVAAWFGRQCETWHRHDRRCREMVRVSRARGAWLGDAQWQEGMRRGGSIAWEICWHRPG